MSTNLTGRTALITGGGSGLGLATARRLADEGCTVTMMGRDEQRVKAAAAAIGRHARWTAGDVADESAVERAVIVAASESGALDVAVLAAGTGYVAPLAAQEADRWNSVLATNVTGAMMCIKHAGRAMAGSGGGSIVAVSSVASALVHRWWSAYCVSKAALDMLVRCAADELGAANVRVNSVRPGLIPTDLAIHLTQNPRVVDDYLDQMPIRRLGTAADVADLICFLAGDEAGWITGQSIGVDGGHHLRRGPVLEPELRGHFGPSLEGHAPVLR